MVGKNCSSVVVTAGETALHFGGMMVKQKVHKLYWRTLDAETHHCFEAVLGRRRGDYPRSYTSLCGHHRLNDIDGGAIRRPELKRRCGKCSFAEMQIRGWEQPGPVR